MNVLENRGGGQIYRLAEKLFPICRSITGDGVRKTLAILAEYIEEYETEYKLKTYQCLLARKYLIGLYRKNGGSERRGLNMRQENGL